VTPPLERQPTRILIVDPSNLLQRQYAGCATAVGFQVESAQHHQEGLEKATLLSPDIVLTGCSPEAGTGVEFCQLLKSRLSTSRIPVLGFVAAKEDGTARAAIAAGCTVIETPCSPERLLVEIVITLCLIDPPVPHTPAVEQVTQMLGRVLREHAHLVQRHADLAVSAQLWANWYERTLARANQGPVAAITAPDMVKPVGCAESGREEASTQHCAV
jgi:CheY-like chemotaxis protein